ncbi:uncharacterized protein, partial [Physeter macrocephalus]|uniref:Uncharacterized protein n=1 Tax=Physeter macrocephalus TaxID=9755 RepID=A0A455B4B1_PHYMC
MIDCVEAFDAAAAAAAERTLEAKFCLSDSQSSHSSDTAAGIPPEWKNSSGVPSNALTSAAALLFPKVATASLPSPRSPPSTNIPAARSSPAAATQAAGSKRITPRSLLETAKEAPWQQKTKAYRGEAEGKAGVSAACDFLSHPVHHLPAAGKPDAGASTATPSVFSPCPSEEAVSPLMEASSCFSAGECTSEDTTFRWDAASSTTSSSTQSTSRNGSAAERKSSSRDHSRSKTKKAEDARTAVGSSVAAALDSPATISQQLCTSSRRPPRGADSCYLENSAALAAQDCWQQPPPFNQQAAVAQRTASAGGAAILPGEALAGCSSGMQCWWDGPAPLEGGRTAATLDYYLGDETCTPATDSCSSTAAFVSEQQQGQRQEIEEAHQREEGQGDMLDEPQRLEKQQKTQ